MVFDPSQPAPGDGSTSSGSDFPGSGSNVAPSGISSRIVNARVHIGFLPPIAIPPPATQPEAWSDAMTVGQALKQFETLPSQAKWDLASQLLNAGFFESSFYGSNPRRMLPADIYKAYENALSEAAVTGRSLEQTINAGAADMLAGGFTGPGGQSGAAGRSSSYSSTTYDLSDPQTAHSILQTATQTLMGRDPTQGETQKFMSAIHGYENANPRVVTESTSVDAAGNTKVRDESKSQGATAQGRADTAEQYLTQNNGSEIAQVQVQNLYDAFQSMLAGKG